MWSTRLFCNLNLFVEDVRNVVSGLGGLSTHQGSVSKEIGEFSSLLGVKGHQIVWKLRQEILFRGKL